MAEEPDFAELRTAQAVTLIVSPILLAAWSLVAPGVSDELGEAGVLPLVFLWLAALAVAAALAAFRKIARATSASLPVDFVKVRVANANAATLVGALDGATLTVREAVTPGAALGDE